MPAFRFSGFLRFHTADDVVSSGIFERQPPAHQRRDDHFVIIVSRQSDTGPCQLRRMDQQILRRTVPYPDGQGRLRQKDMHGTGNTHKGQIVCHILSVFVLSAYDQILEQAVSCKSLSTCCITALIQVV